ncbi:MAG: DUF6498-containing protein [bacterium]
MNALFSFFSSILLIGNYPSAFALLLSNLVPLIGVLCFGWSVFHVLLVYCMETTTVGFFAMLKIWNNQNPNPGNLKINNVQCVKNTPEVRKFVFKTFIMVFCCFNFAHIGILTFLILTREKNPSSFVFPILLSLVTFCCSHGYSYYKNYLQGKENKVITLVGITNAAFARVILTQVVVIFGIILYLDKGIKYGFVLLFVVFKTIFDLFGHMNERVKPGQVEPGLKM